MYNEANKIGRIVKLHWEGEYGWRALVQTTSKGLLDIRLYDGEYNISATKDLYKNG